MGSFSDSRCCPLARWEYGGPRQVCRSRRSRCGRSLPSYLQSRRTENPSLFRKALFGRGRGREVACDSDPHLDFEWFQRMRLCDSRHVESCGQVGERKEACCQGSRRRSTKRRQTSKTSRCRETGAQEVSEASSEWYFAPCEAQSGRSCQRKEAGRRRGRGRWQWQWNSFDRGEEGSTPRSPQENPLYALSRWKGDREAGRNGRRGELPACWVIARTLTLCVGRWFDQWDRPGDQQEGAGESRAFSKGCIEEKKGGGFKRKYFEELEKAACSTSCGSRKEEVEEKQEGEERKGQRCEEAQFDAVEDPYQGVGFQEEEEKEKEIEEWSDRDLFGFFQQVQRREREDEQRRRSRSSSQKEVPRPSRFSAGTPHFTCEGTVGTGSSSGSSERRWWSDQWGEGGDVLQPSPKAAVWSVPTRAERDVHPGLDPRPTTSRRHSPCGRFARRTFYRSAPVSSRRPLGNGKTYGTSPAGGEQCSRSFNCVGFSQTCQAGAESAGVVSQWPMGISPRERTRPRTWRLVRRWKRRWEERSQRKRKEGKRTWGQVERTRCPRNKLREKNKDKAEDKK